MNKVSPCRLDVYRLNLKNGEVVLDTEAPDDLACPDLVVRGYTAELQDGGGAPRVRDNAQLPWRKLMRWGPADYVAAMFFGEAKSRLAMMTSIGSNTTHLEELDLTTGNRHVVVSPGNST
jgi:hypothetical protein